MQSIQSFPLSSGRVVAFGTLQPYTIHEKNIDFDRNVAVQQHYSVAYIHRRYHTEWLVQTKFRRDTILRVVSKSQISINNYDDDSDSSQNATTTTTTRATSKVDNNNNLVQIIKASLLIAGTTVGGGFLAVPQSILIPMGGQFVPAVLSLSSVWLFLFLQSIYLSEAIIITHNTQAKSTSDGTEITIGIAGCVQQNLDGGSNDKKTKSNSKAKLASTITIILLFLLTEATLVSQLSRAGSLLANAITTANNFGLVQSLSSNMIHYRIGCLVATIVGAIGTFGIRKQLVTSIHSLLTLIFLVAVGAVLSTGRSIANWSNCFTMPLIHNNFPLVSGIGQALPTMLQLLVYGEIIPTVCSMLHYQIRSIRTAILLGSFIPLVLLGGWAAFAIALLPSNLWSVSTAIDPVNILLSQGGSVSRWLYTLAISAIGTTIIGCNLALETNYNDMMEILPKSDKGNADKCSSRVRDGWLNVATGGGSWIRKYSSILIPPFVISIISPSLFLKAIDFAGSYPVLILYGIIPSFLRLQNSNRNGPPTQWKIIPYVLFFLSISLVGIETVSDLRSIMLLLFRKFRTIFP